MTPNISPILVGPARSILLVGVVAVASIACGSASAGSSPPTSASAAPSAPSASAPPSASSLHVVLKDDANSGATVDVVDESGTLVGARAAGLAERAPDPAAPSSGDVTVQNVDATTLWIAWTGGACPDAHVLTIDPTGRSISISQPPFCGGDTLGVGRQLVLTFARPVAAADVTATLVAVGQ
jgi:hypothetical protein